MLGKTELVFLEQFDWIAEISAFWVSKAILPQKNEVESDSKSHLTLASCVPYTCKNKYFKPADMNIIGYDQIEHLFFDFWIFFLYWEYWSFLLSMYFVSVVNLHTAMLICLLDNTKWCFVLFFYLKKTRSLTQLSNLLVII